MNSVQCEGPTLAVKVSVLGGYLILRQLGAITFLVLASCTGGMRAQMPNLPNIIGIMSPLEFDLDQNQTNETEIKAQPCDSAHAQPLCLKIKSIERNVDLSIPLETGATVIKIVGIGKHSGQLSDIAVYYTDASTRPVMAVIDTETQTTIALARAPSGVTSSYYDFAKGPGNKSYPFIAPPYATVYGGWNTICVFKPGATSNCGNGFAETSIVPANGVTGGGQSFFREVGGYLQDIDGDGFEDINLIYHWLIYTVSPSTVAPIVTTSFDVGRNYWTQMPGFHSGRNYGTHASVQAANGKLRDVIVGGIPVGSFNDAMCNVSRFVAVLESDPGQPSSRHLAWSNYYSFHSSAYAAYDDSLSSNPPVTQIGDFSNNCIERFSDSRSKMDGEEVIVINYFAQTQGVATCITEQYGFYFGRDTVWYNCMNQNLKSRGKWSMQVIRESDGTNLTGSTGNYIWAWSDKIMPGGDPVYFTEIMPNDVNFDFTEVPKTTLQMRGLHHGSWSAHGSLPNPGRPYLGWNAPIGSRGEGSYTSFVELNTYDIDGDGLQDVYMEDGSWVGWSKLSNTWVVKRAAP